MRWTDLARGLAALALLALSACLPDSVNPLGDPATATPDSRVLGTWQGTMNDQPATLSVTPGEGAMLKIRLETTDTDGKKEWIGMDGFPAEVKKRSYVSIKLREEQDKVYDPAEENYYICRYVLTADNKGLTVWTMSEQHVVNAIADGRINGSVEPAGDERLIHLADSTIMLASLIENSDPDRLFGRKFATFSRISY
jgi:hypothetical protein